MVIENFNLVTDYLKFVANIKLWGRIVLVAKNQT